jgi:hypothetical protein
MRRSTVPARVSHTRSRQPLRGASRPGARSPCAAPVRPGTSSASRRSAAKPIVSRNRSASALCSNSPQRTILSSVIVVVSGLGLLVATRPYRRSRDGHPLWIAGLPTPDSWRSLRQTTSPQLLHHHPGRDPLPARGQQNGGPPRPASRHFCSCGNRPVRNPAGPCRSRRSRRGRGGAKAVAETFARSGAPMCNCKTFVTCKE